MYNNNLAQYKKVEVETTDSLKLIIMLYEGAINFLEQAKLRMDENKVADKGILISKVMAIVSELQGALNMNKGGDVANNIDRIYSYLRERLMEANSKNDKAIIDEILQHLRTLKQAWVQVREKESAAPETELKAAPRQSEAPEEKPEAAYQQSSPESGNIAGGEQKQTNLQAIEFLG